MDFSWLVFAIVFILNFGWIVVMYVAQQADGRMPIRHSVISGTSQRFNYMQDFWTCSYGDTLALPLILNAFGHLAVNDCINILQWIFFAILAGLLGYRFMVMCFSKNHKPDQGYPKVGRISFHGILHLPHFGVSVATTIVSIFHVILGNLRGPVLCIFCVGLILWIVAFVLDVKTGNFDPLKPNSR